MILTTHGFPALAAFALSILGYGIGSVAAVPTNTLTSRANGCTTTTGSFKLFYAPKSNPTDQHLLQLVVRPRGGGGIIYLEDELVLSPCPSDQCSSTQTWLMANGALEPRPYSLVTVNSPVVANSTLNFRRGEIPHGSGAKDYCLVANPSASNGLPNYLAGPGGDVENFSLCTDNTLGNIQSRLAVFYKIDKTHLGAGVWCSDIYLVTQPASSGSTS